MDHAPAYVVDWELAQAERGLASFSAFLGAAGAKFTPPPDLLTMLDTLSKSKPSAVFSPRELFVHQLMTTANKSLSAAGDERQLFLQRTPVERWVLLAPAAVGRAQASGVKLERPGAPGRRGVWMLASIPVAIGVYVLANRVLRERGVDEWVAWLIALAAWFAVRQLMNRTLLKAR